MLPTRLRAPARPLYMVHGIGSCKEGWQELAAHLKDAFTCVTYDLRGHGQSPVPPPPYTLDQLVADLEALRVKLGHQKIHLIGHSLGGMIGPAYARTHPEHTLSVGLLSTAAGRSEEDRAKLEKVGDALEADGLLELLPTLVARWFSDDFLANNPQAVEWRLNQVKSTPEAVFKSVFQYLRHPPKWRLGSHEIEHPCLVLTGEFDGGCNPRLNKFIAGELKNSQLVILDGLKHSILIEAPDRVAAPLRQFLLQYCLSSAIRTHVGARVYSRFEFTHFRSRQAQTGYQCMQEGLVKS